MSVRTILKDELFDILVGLRLTADEMAHAQPSADFLRGYHTALTSVAVAIGIPLTAAAPDQALSNTPKDNRH